MAEGIPPRRERSQFERESRRPALGSTRSPAHVPAPEPGGADALLAFLDADADEAAVLVAIPSIGGEVLACCPVGLAPVADACDAMISAKAAAILAHVRAFAHCSPSRIACAYSSGVAQFPMPAQ
jgi:hypothetical protein